AGPAAEGARPRGRRGVDRGGERAAQPRRDVHEAVSDRNLWSLVWVSNVAPARRQVATDRNHCIRDVCIDAGRGLSVVQTDHTATTSTDLAPAEEYHG